MASVLKQSRRWRWLPRIADGHISVGERYAEYPAGDVRRLVGMPPMMQTLDVWRGSGAERVEYQVQLTEDEALRVAGEWLTQIARRRAQAAAKVKAAS